MNDFKDYNDSFANSDEADLIDANARIIEVRGEDFWEMGKSYVTKFVIDDALARDVRARFGITDAKARVYLTTAVMYGGYSEYTVENEYYCSFECEDKYKSFDGYSDPLNALLDWVTSND